MKIVFLLMQLCLENLRKIGTLFLSVLLESILHKIKKYCYNILLPNYILIDSSMVLEDILVATDILYLIVVHTKMAKY